MNSFETIVSILGKEGFEEVGEYLVQYGYMRSSDAAPLENAGRTLAALRRFQEFYNIDGKNAKERLESTLTAVQAPRCGVEDLIDGEEVPGCPWGAGIDILVWDLADGPADVTRDDVLRELGEASSIWNTALESQNISLRFEQRRQDQPETEVTVLFSWKDLAQRLQVVRPPIARAEYPPQCALRSPELPRPVHFDTSNNRIWAPDANAPGVSILRVAVHELGHILGLGHSHDPGAVMYSLIPQEEELSADDSTALVRLYQNRPTGVAGQPGNLTMAGATPPP